MEKAVYHAMKMCYVKDVDQRSSSLEVEQYLHNKLKKFGISEIWGVHQIIAPFHLIPGHLTRWTVNVLLFKKKVRVNSTTVHYTNTLLYL